MMGSHHYIPNIQPLVFTISNDQLLLFVLLGMMELDQAFS